MRTKGAVDKETEREYPETEKSWKEKLRIAKELSDSDNYKGGILAWE